MKTKTGEKITTKEFIKRWGEGINGITPLQKAKVELSGTRITLLGIVAGIIMTALSFKTLWWVVIILIGAFINTGVSYLALRGQLKYLKQMEVLYNEQEGTV